MKQRENAEPEQIEVKLKTPEKKKEKPHEEKHT